MARALGPVLAVTLGWGCASAAHSLKPGEVVVDGCRPGQGEGSTGAVLAVQVTDPAGQPVPGMPVVAWGRDTRRSNVTNAQGSAILDLDPGKIGVRIGSIPFRAVEVKGLTLQSGCTLTLNVPLQVDGRAVDPTCRPHGKLPCL